MALTHPVGVRFLGTSLQDRLMASPLALNQVDVGSNPTLGTVTEGGGISSQVVTLSFVGSNPIGHPYKQFIHSVL